MASPRRRLARARKAAGYTQETLAFALDVDPSTVNRWERGASEPKVYTRSKVANLLKVSREQLEEMLAEGVPISGELVGVTSPAAIGRPVALSSANELTVRAAQFGLVYAASLPATVEVVAELGRHDMERRQFLTGAMFSVAASIAPSRDWLVATLEETTQMQGKVGSPQIETIRKTFGIFQELDVMRGGGHARTQLTAYLKQVVIPLLQANDPETAQGSELYSAASEQLYLLGWMAFDNGEHPIAQRYLIQSLRLAEAAKNVELGAHVLAGLSDQATLTGNPDHGVQLARTGVAGLSRGRSHACLADLRALQARAEAAMGDAAAASKSVHLSQQAFEQVIPDDEQEWARFIDVAYLNGEYAHAFRDLERPTEAAMFAGVSADDAARQGRARRGSLAKAAMARAALTDHDLDKATAAALEATHLAVTVKSSRSTEAVTDLRTRLGAHRGSPVVQKFFDETDLLVAALA
ncbi:helix-turn-helix transcriptional regulator [Amycolatopsis sp. NPDC051716]|uniref:helix-turn-helix domain-containing protein n=1 Tax=Amycolatopsis sp. NPDC051716 TaxID=3155804 RepID=UPI003430ED55